MTQGEELVRVAQSQVGRPAILHQEFAGDCITRPNERCLAAGMDPRGFDCSGLVIYAYNELSGAPHWQSDARHVRDMWGEAETRSLDIFPIHECALGALAVWKRKHTTVMGQISVPGHIGIVSEVGNAGDFVVVHAGTDRGFVEEKKYNVLSSKFLGFIGLRGIH